MLPLKSRALDLALRPNFLSLALAFNALALTYARIGSCLLQDVSELYHVCHAWPIAESHEYVKR